MATIAIDEAIARGGSQSKINEALKNLNAGDVEAGKDRPDKAIDKYKTAWKKALEAQVEALQTRQFRNADSPPAQPGGLSS